MAEERVTGETAAVCSLGAFGLSVRRPVRGETVGPFSRHAKHRGT